MVRNQPRFTARYHRQQNGWMAAIEGGDATSAFGRSLESARIALTAQLAARYKQYRGVIVINDEVELDKRTLQALDDARATRIAALEATEQSRTATNLAIRALHSEGVSLRDAAYLLGISHSRVQQILEAEK